jgi:Capsular polysaccharide synthesis protein
MNEFIMILMVIVLVVCWIGFGEKPAFIKGLYENRVYNEVPRKIWTYWDNPDKVPKTVQMCMRGWAEWNPTYEIVLLTKKNYQGYVTIPYEVRTHPNFHDNPTRFADLVRVWILAEQGGVWVDSSILLNSSLDDWLFPKYAEFSGFYIDGFTKNPQYPVIENWFFACNKGSSFLQLWRDEFTQIVRYPNVENYVESRKQMGVNFEGFKDLSNYLAMHVAAQKVLQIDRYPINNMILQKAEDGPLRYVVDAKWNSEKAVRLACHDRSYRIPILKMRSGERKIVEQGINDEFSEEKCAWIE